MKIYKNEFIRIAEYDYDGQRGTYREHISESKKKLQIGGSDACQGDSGSPLIKWQRIRKNGKISQKAYLIGIVSRGEWCARSVSTTTKCQQT